MCTCLSVYSYTCSPIYMSICQHSHCLPVRLSTCSPFFLCTCQPVCHIHAKIYNYFENTYSVLICLQHMFVLNIASKIVYISLDIRVRKCLGNSKVLQLVYTLKYRTTDKLLRTLILLSNILLIQGIYRDCLRLFI